MSWSFFETIGNQGIQFIIGVFLARLLIPEDFGLIGALSIFIGVAGVLVDGGFKISIIRSRDSTEVDYSTIFYINIIVSLFISIFFFFLAPFLSTYFNKPELCNITKALSVLPILNGFGLVQSAILNKNLKFKENAKISLASNFISGVIALLIAYNNYSYWALVWRSIIASFLYTLILWISNDWRPKLVFSVIALRKHFKFGSKLLLTGVIDAFFDNIYSFIFGKYFSMKDLGFFTRGKGYADLATTSISVAVQKVSTPLLSYNSLGNDDIFKTHIKLFRSSSLLIFTCNALLFSISEPLIVLLIGAKWIPAIPFLQVFSISGMIYSILNSNSSFLQVMGRSDLILKNTLVGRPIQIIILIITIQFQSIFIAWGIVIHYFLMALISFYIVSLVSKKRFIVLIKPLFQPALISFTMGIIVFFTGKLLTDKISVWAVIIVQISEALIIVLGFMKILNLSEYLVLKKLKSKIAIKIGLTN